MCKHENHWANLNDPSAHTTVHCVRYCEHRILPDDSKVCCFYKGKLMYIFFNGWYVQNVTQSMGNEAKELVDGQTNVTKNPKL